MSDKLIENIFGLAAFIVVFVVYYQTIKEKMKAKKGYKLVFWGFVLLTLFCYIYTLVDVVSAIFKIF